MRRCENCEELQSLRKRVHDLGAQVRQLEKQKEELETEVRYFELNSIQISLEDKFLIWELHEKRKEAKQADTEKERQKELDKLLGDLER